MKRYDKEFKEQALILSDEIGVKKLRNNWEFCIVHLQSGENKEQEKP